MASEELADTTGAAARVRSRAWTATFGLALLMAMFVSTFPQYAIGVLAPILVDELRIGAGVLGVVASLMYLSASLLARVAGGGADVVSGRIALAMLFACAIASLVVLAASGSLVGLVLAALLSGGAMALNNPVTNRLIVVNVAPGRRGMLMGVKQAGVKVAHLTAGAALPTLALTVGWRAGLVGVAVVSGLILVAAAVVIPRSSGTEPRAVGRLPAEVLRQVRWLQYVAGALAVGMTALTTYLALYAVERVALTLTQAGLVVAALGLTAVVARLAWATVIERLDDPTGALVLISGGGALGLLTIGAAEPVGAWLLWVGAVGTALTAGSFNVVVQMVVVTEVDPARAAAASGRVQGAFLLGLAVGAPVFGGIVETTGSFGLAWGVAAAIAVVALGVVVGERRERRRHGAAADHSRGL